MRPVDPRLLRASRAARLHLALAVLLGVVSAALIVVQAVLLARVVAGAFMEGASPAQLSGELWALAAVSVGRALVAAGFESAGRIGAQRALSELRGRVVEHLMRAHPGGLPGRRSGEVIAAAVQGVDALEAYFARYLPQLVLGTVVPPAIVAYLLGVDLPAALVLAFTLPLIPLFMVLVGRRAQEATDARWRTLGLLSGHFLDVVRGLDTLRAHNRGGVQAQTIGTVSERLRAETMGALRVAFLSALVLELLAMFGVALVAATVGVQLVGGHIGLEAGLAVLILAPELYAPLRAVGAQFHASADGLSAAQELFELLEAEPAVAGPTRPRLAPNPAYGPVRVEGVGFAHLGRGEWVLDGADLELAPGELVALTGASGAGKSTLAALLLRFAAPDAGRITCCGIDLAQVDQRAWRERVAWVPQRPRLFAGTLADNVRLGAPGASDAQVRAALRAAAGIDVAAIGLDTPLGEGGWVLSAGQVQRVGVARALLRDAPLLILDEPTANLDAESAAMVTRSIAAQARTTLVITHRPELAERADRTLDLAGGKLREAGRPVQRAVA